ncbi:hypothetical protein HDU67_008603 [Dinochytrium kinnereticum]|nr:hypothetical protein HDU67_008603 [Dinochytrium kinnereticum]
METGRMRINAIPVLAPLAQEHEECEQILLMTQMLMSMANGKPSAESTAPRPLGQQAPAGQTPVTPLISLKGLEPSMCPQEAHCVPPDLDAFNDGPPVFSLPAETLQPLNHDSLHRAKDLAYVRRGDWRDGWETPEISARVLSKRDAAAKAFITPVTTTVNSVAPSPDADLMFLSRYAESELNVKSPKSKTDAAEKPSRQKDDRVGGASPVSMREDDYEYMDDKSSPITGLNALVKVAEEILGNTSSSSRERSSNPRPDEASSLNASGVQQTSPLTKDNSLPLNVVGALPTMPVDLESQFVGSPQNSYNMQYWQNFARQNLVQQSPPPRTDGSVQNAEKPPSVTISATMAGGAQALHTPTTPISSMQIDSIHDPAAYGPDSSAASYTDETASQPLTAPLTPRQSAVSVVPLVTIDLAVTSPTSDEALEVPRRGRKRKIPPTRTSEEDTGDSEGVRKGGEGPGARKVAGIKARPNFPPDVLRLLTGWLNDNLGHPYPPQDVKHQLARQTGLKLKQVNDWFINARRRRLF